MNTTNEPVAEAIMRFSGRSNFVNRSGKIIDVLRHGEPEGWPDAAAMQEAWDREEGGAE